jgi:hypothetical protein
MRAINNIQNLGVSELLYELYISDQNTFVCEMDLYLQIKRVTNNFDNMLMQMLLANIKSFWYEFVLYDYKDKQMPLYNIAYNSWLLKRNDRKHDDYYYENFVTLGNFIVERSTLIDNEIFGWRIESYDIEVIKTKGYEKILRYSNLVVFEYISQYSIDDLEIWANDQYRTFKGITNAEKGNKIETINPLLKRPQNTHKQQFAIIESIGVIDYLKRKYNGITDVKLAELIANILNKDAQNTRTMLSFTGTKNQESNEEKIKDFLNNLFDKIEL